MPGITENMRYRRVESILKRDKIPWVNRYLEGLEDLVRAYGLEPHIDVFIPLKDFELLPVKLKMKIRRKFRYNREANIVTMLDEETLADIRYELEKVKLRQQADKETEL